MTEQSSDGGAKTGEFCAGTGLAAADFNRATAQLSPPAIGLAEREARLLTLAWVNPAAAELLADSAGGLVGRQVECIGDVQRRDDPDDWRPVVADLVRRRGGQAAAGVRRADHRRTRVWLRVTPMDRGPLDVPVWHVQLTSTSDELACAREAVIEAEHRFEALARRAPIGIFVSEVGLRLGYVNEAMAEMVGRATMALLGTGWLDLVHPSDRPALFETVERVLGGSPADLTLRIISTADSQRWVHVRLAPVTTPRRSAGFIGTMEDVTARRAWEEQLAYRASHDALTGLANRRRLIEALSRLIEGHRLNDRQFAVLFCDLDGFKAVNDTLGHDTGDRVLIEVARRLTGSARDHDLVARVAGDEFVVVLRSIADRSEAEACARRQLSALDAPFYISGRDVALSASLGVAFPTVGDNPESLLRAADRVMYQAKARGPGGLRVAEQPPRAAQDSDLLPWTPPSPRNRLSEEGPQ